MHPYNSIDTTAAWKKLRFILSIRSDFHRIDSLLIAVQEIIYIKMDLALNNLQRLICHKTHETKPEIYSDTQEMR